MRIIEQTISNFVEQTIVYKFVQTGARVSDVSGGGDMTKAVYDPTTVNGDAFDMENMAEGATKKILSATAKAGPSQAEAEAGTSTVLKLWSALRVWQAIKSAWLSITAQGWTVIDLGTVVTTLVMNSALGSEFLATLPTTGTTTTISISNLPAIPSAWPVLHLITGATFDEPVWSGIDSTDITLIADTTHNIGFQPVKTTSGWIIVATLMTIRDDA